MPDRLSDRLALEQIFGNLIDNAVKYLDPDAAGPSSPCARARTGSRIVVEVEDNGRGIAAQDHERIFELFRRSGAQDSPARASALPMCARWSAASAATSPFDSELGRGTTFHVSLPANLDGPRGDA